MTASTAFSLSLAQSRLFPACASSADVSASYNLTSAFRLRGPLAVERLQNAFEACLQRHSALRTTFAIHDGKPCQCHAEEVHPIRVFEVGNSSDNALTGIWRSVHEAPYDLAKGPLYRTVLARVSQDEHVLFFGAHHLVCDGTSVRVILKDLAAEYAGDGKRKEATAGYAQHVAREGTDEVQEMIAKNDRFWKSKLAGREPMMFPPDLRRPAQGRGMGLSYAVDVGARSSIAHLCGSVGATLFMGLIAITRIALYRYTHGSDATFGIPISGRDSLAAKEVVGLFATLTPLRVQISREDGINDVFQKARNELIEALEHQKTRLESAADADMAGGAAQFDAIVLWEDHWTAFALDGVSTEPLSFADRSLRFDLVFKYSNAGDRVQLTIEYNGSLFAAGRIQRLAALVQTIVAKAVTNPAEQVAAMEVTRPEEKRQLLHEFRGPTVALDPRDDVLAQLEKQIGEQPHAEAVAWSGGSLSRGDLYSLVRRIAAGLRARDVGPGDRVCVTLKRDAHAIASLLAVMYCGAAYVAVDPADPEKRKQHVISDSGARIIICADASSMPLGGDRAPIVSLEQLLRCTEDGAGTAYRPNPSDAAYIIYTSGSTGLPKGVLANHRGLANLVSAHRVMFGAPQGGRVLQFAALSFDASVSEIFATLCNGNSLYLYDVKTAAEPIASVLESQAITAATLPPSVLRTIRNLSCRHPLTVISAGEECDAGTFAGLPDEVRCINAYGPTEYTVCATYHSSDRLQLSDPIPIGRPIQNTFIRILSGAQLCPIGAVGEICIGGAGVTCGYIGRDDLTAERYVDDPFGEGPMFRTGDLGSWREDGSVRFHGRADSQVKIAGHRVELGEIEAAIYATGLVQEAAAIVRPAARGGVEAHAFFVGSAAANEIRDAVRATLPAYMVPACHRLDVIPKLPSGKIDRKALIASATTAPAEEMEVPEHLRQILGLWARAIGRERIANWSPGMTFMDAGGTSTDVLNLIGLLREEYGLHVNFQILASNPTLEQQATAVQQAMVEVCG